MKKIVLIIAVILIVSGVGYYFYKDNKAEELKKKIESELKLKEKKINDIKSHYNKYVIVNKDSDILDENNNLVAKVYEGTNLILEDVNIDEETDKFNVENMGYIKYKNVNVSEEVDKDSRYKNYIPFNKNIITKDEYTLYDKEGNKRYTFYKSSSYPILIDNYDNRYFVEYDNELMYINKSDVAKTVINSNSKISNASKVTTLCYHRVYDEKQRCDNYQLCKSKSNFDREMKYLSDSKFFTMTTEEMYLYVTKKLQVPKKSVVITLDDGKMQKNAVDVLEKYNLKGTIFMITSRLNEWDSLKSPNIDFQSHTHDMHTTGVCRTTYDYQQGGGILCLDSNKIITDLKKTIEILGDGTVALAYPFYDFNDRAISLVEKAGLKIAFVGAAGVSGRATTSTNRFKVPRMTIWNSTTLDEFKSYVNN